MSFDALTIVDIERCVLMRHIAHIELYNAVIEYVVHSERMK